MACKHSKKPCGCPVLKWIGKDKHWGTLQGLCAKCRKTTE